MPEKRRAYPFEGYPVICRHYLVHGRVQGVFYRASTQETALRLGLTGWVRNRHDGSVELVACGESDRLRALEEWLHEGPRHAQVDAVQVREKLADELFDDFVVRHDG